MKTAVSLLMLLLIPLLALAVPGETAVPPPDLAVYPWAFWREPPLESQGSGEATLIFVGDVLLGRGVDPSADPLRDVTPWLSAADLTIGNLEGYIAPGELPIANRQSSIVNPQSTIHLSMPVTAVAALRRAGFDLLSVANNHSLDGGTEGLQETVTRLRHAGLRPIGLARSDPVLVTVNGVRLAFFAFTAIPPAPTEGMTPAPQFWDAAAAVPAIQAARAQADGVIVLMHWGFEYEARPDPAQERIAQTLLDAGADLVVGQHPHVAQPVAVIGNGVVAYSLGNFLFDQDHDGLALRALFAADGLRGVQLLPVRAAVRPYLLPLAAAQPLLQRVLPPPPRIGFACTDETCAPVAVAQTAQSGQFYSGQIDLTGDGLPEIVRLEGEQVAVYVGETAVWRSPAAWRVVDVALGDPNDDGRYEIMLAIWQADGAGHERSQPYIVGYRGGEYRLLWGGRPLADPIQELALGDVDGDGLEELIVIETLADGSAQAVSVWQWQGWTFALQWRGHGAALGVGDGRLQDLHIADAHFSVAVARTGQRR